MTAGVRTAGGLPFFLIMVGPAVQKAIKRAKRGPVSLFLVFSLSGSTHFLGNQETSLAVGSEEVGGGCVFKQKSIMGRPRAQGPHCWFLEEWYRAAAVTIKAMGLERADLWVKSEGREQNKR